MPIYFFTQANLLSTQTDVEAFGPVVGDLEKKYRVCSLHKFSSDAIAYSIAKGDVKIQEITGTTVNLILKPENPAVAEGLKIKYIIYRGIKKDSLIAGNIIAPTGTNDLTTTIWAEHQKMITATASSPTPVTGDPSQDILGINLQSLPGTDLIEKLFTHNPNMVNPTIEGGKSIGLFDKTGAGLEIVMEGYFLDDTLASVRTLDHVVDAGAFANTFANKAIREKVTNYLEPCAFYGYIPIGDLEILNSAPIPAKPTASDFFVQVTKAKFFNYNVMYVDIRNQSDLSHIYYSASYDYKIYDLLFRTSPASTSVTLDYATNKWPVFTCRAPAGGLTLYTGNALFTFGFDKEIFEIKPILYFPAGVNAGNFAAGTKTKYFIDETNFFTGGAHFFTVPASKDKIIFDGVGLGSTGFHASGSNPGGVMANYLRFSFFREIDQVAAGATPLKFPRKTVYDNLFPVKALPTGITVPANSSLVYRTGVSSYAKFEIKEDPADNYARYISGIFESFVAFESNRVTLFAMLVVKHNFWGEFIEPNTIPAGEKPGSSFFKYLETVNKSQVELAKHELKITTTNKPAFLNYTQVFDKIASVSKPFIILGVSLTTAEYAQIATAATTATLDASLHPVFLQLHDVQEQPDLNNVRYKKTQLNLRGLTTAGAFTNGLTNPLAAPTFVYSTQALFFSKDAAALEPIALTAYKRTNFGTLKIEITPPLQAALSNLSIEKQNLFTELMKLPSFTKYANKIAAATGIVKIKFKHATLTGALAQTLPDVTGLPDNYSIGITIHPPFLIEGSPAAIIKTIVHEMIHASVDFETYAICKAFTRFTAAQRTLLKNSRNPNGRIYSELYCKFGETDKPPASTPVIDDNICERSFSHNYMGLYTRIDIENSVAEYETNNAITRNDIALVLKDKFLPSTPAGNDHVPMTLTKQMVYAGLSWQGIERTREYRKLASVDAASKQTYQLYSVAASHEINALNYNLPPSTNSASQNKPFFEPVTTPTVQICTP